MELQRHLDLRVFDAHLLIGIECLGFLLGGIMTASFDHTLLLPIDIDDVGFHDAFKTC